MTRIYAIVELPPKQLKDNEKVIKCDLYIIPLKTSVVLPVGTAITVFSDESDIQRTIIVKDVWYENSIDIVGLSANIDGDEADINAFVRAAKKFKWKQYFDFVKLETRLQI